MEIDDGGPAFPKALDPYPHTLADAMLETRKR